MKIDLRGPDGNAWAIQAHVRSTLEQLGMDRSDIKAVLKNMRSSDYQHLLRVAREETGGIVDFYDSEEEEE